MRVFNAGDGIQEAGIEGSRELSRDQLIGTRKRFTLTYLVKPSVGEDPCLLTEEDAMAATGIPSLRSLSGSAYCIAKSAKELNSLQGIWQVVAQFDSHNVLATAAPTVEWNWDSETQEKVIQRDPYTGNAIRNAVGEPLLCTAPISIPVLTIERIESSFNPAIITTYENRVNLTSFWGAPAGCALLAKIKDTPFYESGLLKRKVSYTVKFDLSYDYDTGTFYGWAVQLLNHGTRYRFATVTVLPDFRIVPDNIYLPFVDLYGNPTTGNLELDGLPRHTTTHPTLGYPLYDPTLDPTWILYNRFQRAELNNLSLGPY